MFRKLRASEIEARVATVTDKGCSLLLYKDARVDQNILDETVGCLNWKRSHQLIGDRLYCTVEIWDKDKGQWISKQDVGTESYTEKEKGQASDSFKRACFNLGIGRELYTAPFIWINAKDVTLQSRNGKNTTYDKFSVESIGYDSDGNINQLTIKNTNLKRIVYRMIASTEKSTEQIECETAEAEKADFESHAQEVANEKISKADVAALKARYSKPEVQQNVFEHFGISSWEEMTVGQMSELINAKEKK